MFGIPGSPEPVVQLAYVVADLEPAAADFARRTGAGPFFLRDNAIPDATGPGGEPGRFDHVSAYGQWGRLQIELVQVRAAAPAAFAATTATPGVHHIAVLVRDFAEASARLTACGRPALLTARSPSGNAFAFHDARAELGHLVEIYEPRPSILRLYREVAAAADGWDGRDPVRWW